MVAEVTPEAIVGDSARLYVYVEGWGNDVAWVLGIKPFDS